LFLEKHILVLPGSIAENTTKLPLKTACMSSTLSISGIWTFKYVFCREVWRRNFSRFL